AGLLLRCHAPGSVLSPLRQGPRLNGEVRVRIGPGPEGRKFRPGGGGKEKETGTDPVSPTTRPRVFSCSLASYPFLGSRTGSVACVINGWLSPRVSGDLVPRPAAGSGRT